MFEKPTFEQLTHFHNEVDAKRICRQDFQGFLKSPKKWQQQGAFMVPAEQPIVSASNFPDQVIIGLLRNWQTAVAALKASGRQLDSYGRHLVTQTKFAQEPRVIKTRRQLVRGMGFERQTRYDAILERTGGMGREYLAEVAIMIAIAYTRQSLGEVLRMAMPTLLDPDRDPYVFYFERDFDGLWLDADYASPGLEFGLDCEFASGAST